MSSVLLTLPDLSLSNRVHILSKAAGVLGGNEFFTKARHSALLRVPELSTSYLGHTLSTKVTHSCGKSVCFDPPFNSKILDCIFVTLTSCPALTGLIKTSEWPPPAFTSTQMDSFVEPSILAFYIPGNVRVTLKPLSALSFVIKKTAPKSFIKYCYERPEGDIVCFASARAF